MLRLTYFHRTHNVNCYWRMCIACKMRFWFENWICSQNCVLFTDECADVFYQPFRHIFFFLLQFFTVLRLLARQLTTFSIFQLGRSFLAFSTSISLTFYVENSVCSKNVLDMWPRTTFRSYFSHTHTATHTSHTSTKSSNFVFVVVENVVYIELCFSIFPIRIALYALRRYATWIIGGGRGVVRHMRNLFGW